MDQVTLVHSNFDQLDAILDGLHLAGVDGMLFDLGVSSPQLDDGGPGLLLLADAPLDMRMDRSEGLTAADGGERAGPRRSCGASSPSTARSGTPRPSPRPSSAAGRSSPLRPRWSWWT